MNHVDRTQRIRPVRHKEMGAFVPGSRTFLSPYPALTKLAGVRFLPAALAMSAKSAMSVQASSIPINVTSDSGRV